MNQSTMRSLALAEMDFDAIKPEPVFKVGVWFWDWEVRSEREMIKRPNNGTVAKVWCRCRCKRVQHIACANLLGGHTKRCRKCAQRMRWEAKR